jgi:hypothetical protein
VVAAELLEGATGALDGAATTGAGSTGGLGALAGSAMRAPMRARSMAQRCSRSFQMANNGVATKIEE